MRPEASGRLPPSVTSSDDVPPADNRASGRRKPAARPADSAVRLHGLKSAEGQQRKRLGPEIHRSQHQIHGAALRAHEQIKGVGRLRHAGTDGALHHGNRGTQASRKGQHQSQRQRAAPGTAKLAAQKKKRIHTSPCKRLSLRPPETRTMRTAFRQKPGTPTRRNQTPPGTPAHFDFRSSSRPKSRRPRSRR